MLYRMRDMRDVGYMMPRPRIKSLHLQCIFGFTLSLQFLQSTIYPRFIVFNTNLTGDSHGEPLR